MEDKPLILSVLRGNNGHYQFSPASPHNVPFEVRRQLGAKLEGINMAIFGPTLKRQGQFTDNVLRECVEIGLCKQPIPEGLSSLDLAVVVRTKRLSDPALPAALLALL